MQRAWLLLLALTAAVSIARADERILAWQSDIRVRPDSTLEVTETLRVRSEGADAAAFKSSRSSALSNSPEAGW